MTATRPPRPVDLCLEDRGPQAQFTRDARVRAVRFSALIARPEFAAPKDTASDVYWAVAAARCDCPTVAAEGGGLTLTWEYLKRTLAVRVEAGGAVRYRLAVVGQEDRAAWTEVTDRDALDSTFFRLGRYVAAVPKAHGHAGTPGDDPGPS
jgi:hypothetical protein